MTDQAKRILVCDDEPHLREMVGEYLVEKGYSVGEAASASALKAELEHSPADLIILDVNMPGTDGLAALRDIRATSTTPVIMLTAAVDVIDRVVGLEMEIGRAHV